MQPVLKKHFGVNLTSLDQDCLPSHVPVDVPNPVISQAGDSSTAQI